MKILKRYILAFYILTLMTFGFWVNFTPLTLIIDISGILIVLYIVVFNKGKFRFFSEYKTVYIETGIFFFWLFLVTIISGIRGLPLRMCVLGYRDYFEFMLLGFLVMALIPDEESYERYLNYITIFSVAMCMFGLFQFFFYDRLPDRLIHVKSGRLDYVYGLGNLIFRINGLYENAIVFNGIIIIASALTFGAILVKGITALRLFAFGITVAANILTFSRMALAGSAMVYVVEYLLLGKRGKLEKYIKIIAVGVIGVFLFMTLGSGTALYQRLFNSSITASSDIVHTTTIAQARTAIKENWLLGLGMGTQGYDSSLSTVGVIRDGCWMQFALELGLPLTLWLWVMLLTLLATAKRRLNYVSSSNQKIICGVYIASTLYFMAASFINSSYNAKEVFGLCWVITGLMLWNPQTDPETCIPAEDTLKNR